MRTIPNTSRLRWRKSSYSSDTGGECVECATSGEVVWRKSGHSADTDCVECARLAPTAVAVRDSKRPDGPHLTLPAAGFAAFVQAVATDTLR